MFKCCLFHSTFFKINLFNKQNGQGKFYPKLKKKVFKITITCNKIFYLNYLKLNLP